MRVPAGEGQPNALSRPTDGSQAPVETSPDALQGQAYLHVQLRHKKKAVHRAGLDREAFHPAAGKRVVVTQAAVGIRATRPAAGVAFPSHYWSKHR